MTEKRTFTDFQIATAERGSEAWLAGGSGNALDHALGGNRMADIEITQMDRYEFICRNLPRNEAIDLTIENFDLHIKRTDEGIVVDIFDTLDEERVDSMGSTYAFDNDTQGGQVANTLRSRLTASVGLTLIDIDEAPNYIHLWRVTSDTLRVNFGDEDGQHCERIYDLDEEHPEVKVLNAQVVA